MFELASYKEVTWIACIRHLSTEALIICQDRVFASFLCVLSYRSSSPGVLLRKGVLKISRKFTGEHPCQSLISIRLKSNFIEITLRHGCSPVNLRHICRTPFSRNTSGWLLLIIISFRKLRPDFTNF